MAKIPARRTPEAVDRLIAHYERHRNPGELPRGYFQRLDLAEARALVSDLAELTEATARPEDFIDLDSDVPFDVVALDGECAA